jgi:hypothetical protein
MFIRPLIDPGLIRFGHPSSYAVGQLSQFPILPKIIRKYFQPFLKNNFPIIAESMEEQQKNVQKQIECQNWGSKLLEAKDSISLNREQQQRKRMKALKKGKAQNFEEVGWI